MGPSMIDSLADALFHGHHAQYIEICAERLSQSRSLDRQWHLRKGFTCGVMIDHKIRFITTPSNHTNPNRLDSKTRKSIRARAASAGRSWDADDRSDRHEKESIATKRASQRGGMTRFRAGHSATTNEVVLSSENRHDPLSLNRQVSVWDPVVGPLGDQAWNLFHYYRYAFRSRSWAIHAKRDWFAFVIEDPAAAHATLCFTSLNRDLDERDTISAWTLSHRHEAVRLVRHQLMVRNDLPTDGMIAAVSLLAIGEGLEGNAASSLAHAKALAKLVSLRGGRIKLRYNAPLSALIAWADLCHVSTFSAGPRPSSLFDKIDVMEGQSYGLTSIHEETIPTLKMEQVLPHRVSQMVKLLRTVPIYPPSEVTTEIERQNVNGLIHDINETLLIIHHEEASQFTGLKGSLTEVLCYAAHLYISLVLRQMPRRCWIVTERALRLETALHGLDFLTSRDQKLDDSYVHITFWARTLHFCSLLDVRQQGWDLTSLRSFLAYLGVFNLEQFQYYLSKISWVRSIFDSTLQFILP